MIENGKDDLVTKEMGLLEKEFMRYPKRRIFPRTKVRVKPFDVETTFSEVISERENRARKYHGPDSPLYSANYPLVCIMKVFGLAPYDFTGDEMTPSNACLIFSLAFMCIYCHIMYIVYLRFTTFKRHKPVLGVVETTKVQVASGIAERLFVRILVYTVLTFLQVIVNYLVAMYELASAMYTRKAFCRFWNSLQDFDERLRRLGYPRDEVNAKIAVWTLLASQTILWTLVNQSGMYAFMETWLFNMSYMCVYVGTAISVYKFFGMACFLGQRFHQLNRIAKENLPPRQGYRSSTVSRKTIQDLHYELLLSAGVLNSLYRWSLLFWLGNLSVHSISNLYFIIDWVLLTRWSAIAWPLIFNMCMWLIGFMSQLVALHIVCDYATTEANSMGAILIKWDARILQRFPYDIVGVLSTYLIILLQFPS